SVSVPFDCQEDPPFPPRRSADLTQFRGNLRTCRDEVVTQVTRRRALPAKGAALRKRHATCDVRSATVQANASGEEGTVVVRMASLEQVIGQFRRMLPAESATAQEIDRNEPWERIAMNAVDDGYIEFANELGSFIEVCLRRGS